MPKKPTPTRAGLVQQKIAQLQPPRERSPAKRRRPSDRGDSSGMESVRELLEEQLEQFALIKEEFKEIASNMKTELSSLSQRVKDLEEHTNKKDAEIEVLKKQLEKKNLIMTELQKKSINLRSSPSCRH